MLSLETILKDTIWVVKMQGWRMSGTYDEMKPYAEDEDCRDFDISAFQPEHLSNFYDKYFEYENEHGWITIPEFYNNVYSMRELDK